MRRLARAALLFLPLGAALLVPSGDRGAAARDPLAAAARAEEGIVPLGLAWGRLRGWQRVGEGWLLAWQPAHGAWMVHAWVPDGGQQAAWRIDAAAWLPGARLSSGAGALMLGWPAAAPVAEERPGRRDWFVGTRRLLGALPGGGGVPIPAPPSPRPWDAVLVGLLLAGTVARVVFPALPVRLSRRTVSWLAVALVLSLPWLTPMAGGLFQVGVRPWVTQFVVAAVVALLLGTVIFAVVAFPAAVARPVAAPLAVAFAVGVLAGRLAPPGWVPALEALTVRTVPYLALVVVGGWLVALAGDGLRQMLGGTAGTRRWILAGLAVVMALTAGDRIGVVAAVLLAASVDRPQGVWVGGAVLWGWAAGAVVAGCAWPEALRHGMLLLLGGVAVLGAGVVVDARTGAPSGGEIR